MGKHTGSTSRSYDHRIQYIGRDHYRLSWTFDRKVEGSRLRFPTTTRRDTDLAGAERFAKRWEVTVPAPRDAAGLVVAA